MKRREIVVEQAEPFGPIIARATTRRRAAPRPVSTRTPRSRRSTSRWSRSHDRGTDAGRRRRGRRRLDELDPTEDEAAPEERPPGELTEAGLEALLFVAERPLTRREIAAIAGVDRATVDARLGDLEVACASAASGSLLDGDRVELATAPEAGALVARYVGADAVRLVAGVPRDARDRRLSPAGHEGRRRADPRRRLRLHDPDPPASPARRRARAARTPRAGRSCTAPRSSSSSGSG